MYFRQYWKDERLRYNDTGYDKRLAFNPEMLKFIWVPDTHFPGIKDGLRHDITDENEVVRLQPNGSVLYSMRYCCQSCWNRSKHVESKLNRCWTSLKAFNVASTTIQHFFCYRECVEWSWRRLLPCFNIVWYVRAHLSVSQWRIYVRIHSNNRGGSLGLNNRPLAEFCWIKTW